MGTEGNARLTAITGMVLFALLAVEGVTILSVVPMLSVHVFVGLLLIPPVALKLGSTGWRFMRYYTGNAEYRRKGPPPTPLRLMAPVIVITSIGVLASGVALLLAGPSSKSTLMPIHKVSFIVWLAFTSVHVLWHIWSIPGHVRADLPGARPLAAGAPGRAVRWLLVGSALGCGVALGVALLPHTHAWQQFHP
jgi:hypothetical protein